MRRGRGVTIFTLGLLIFLGASVGVAGESGLTAIRIAAKDAAAFDRLGMAPATDMDYGSFRW